MEPGGGWSTAGWTPRPHLEVEGVWAVELEEAELWLDMGEPWLDVHLQVFRHPATVHPPRLRRIHQHPSTCALPPCPSRPLAPRRQSTMCALYHVSSLMPPGSAFTAPPFTAAHQVQCARAGRPTREVLQPEPRLQRLAHLHPAALLTT